MPVRENEDVIYRDRDTKNERGMDEGDILTTQTNIDKKREFFKELNEENFMQQKQASFVFSLFKYGEHLFYDIPGMGTDRPPISDANLTRLFYLATFCKKDDPSGRLTCGRGETYMNRKQVNQKLNISKNKLTEFWQQMTEWNIIYENKNGEVCINPIRFRKGKLDNDDIEEYHSNYTRVYCKSIQALYESCDSPNMHKKMSYIFKMLPYINRVTNILSATPWETNKENIIAMNFGDWCEKIGYDRHNSRRLLNELTKITIHGQHIIGFAGTTMNVSSWNIVLNPRLFYGGMCRFKDENINKNSFSYEGINNFFNS